MSLHNKYSIFNNNPRASRGGQVMVEAIVALSALTLGFLAILALLNQSLGSAAVVSDRNIATYLAAEGIEIVRNLSDANIRLGAPNGGFGEDFKTGNFETSPFSLLEFDAGLPGFETDSDNFNPGSWLDAGGGPRGAQAPKPFWIKVAEAANARFLKYDSQKGYNYDAGTPTKFQRIIRISKPVSNSYLQVSSEVTWTGKNGLSDKIVLTDFFFNWR